MERALHASGYLKILYAIFAIIYIISLPGDVSTSLNMTIGWDTHTRTDTNSERSYTRNVLIRSASRNGGEKANAELDVKYK